MRPAPSDRLPERAVPPDADRILAAEYVLGTLDSEDRRRVRARCATEPQFAALVRLWERRLAPLHELAVPVIPAPDIWRAIASDLRSAPPALRGATLPRGVSPSPDPPRRPALPEGRPVRSSGGGEGTVSRVRRLFGLAPARRQENGRETARGEASGNPGRLSRRAFPPRGLGAEAPFPDPARPDAATLDGAVRDVRPAGLPPPLRPQIALPQVSDQAASHAQLLPAAARHLEPPASLKLVPPPPRARPAPEPLTPPPAFMFLEPDPPPEPEPVVQEETAAKADTAPVDPADAGKGARDAAAPAGGEEPSPAPAEGAEGTYPLAPVAPQPVAPEPVAAQPAAPEPIVPEPVPSEPVAIEAVLPESVPVAAIAAVAPPHAPVEAVDLTAAGGEASVAPASAAEAEPAAGDIPAVAIAPVVAAPDNVPSPAEAVAAVSLPPDEAPAPASADAVEPAPAPPEAGAAEVPSADPAAGEKGEEAPLPGWAAEVASGEVSALPDEPAAPSRIVVRHGPWRGICLLLALLCVGLGGLAAYREWIWPGEGYWVAVLQAEPLPAISARIDPDSGVLHVRSFAPAPPEGETYRLWLVPPGGAARLVGAFTAGLSERVPELARLGRRGLSGAEMVVTREPTEGPAASDGAGREPGEAVVYRGRLVPE